MNFESLMGEGVALQSQGLHSEALSIRQAANMAARTDVEKARALRDISASLFHLKNVDNAVVVAEDSIQKLEEVKDITPARNRELAASEMWSGTLALDQAVSLERVGMEHEGYATDSLGFFRSALQHIHEVKSGVGGVEQYEINMLGRTAIAEALYGGDELTGDPRLAARMSLRAILLAPLSESRFTITHNTEMGIKQRARAKFNAFVRGGAALAVTGLNSGFNMRKRAIKLANHVL